MKSYTLPALGIACKIWLIALLLNSIADTLLFGGLSLGTGEVFLLVAMFGGLFSIPVFLLLWTILYNLFHSGRPANYILKIVLLTGVGLAVAACFVFTIAFNFFDLISSPLAIIAPVSGAIAIGSSYPNIKSVCFKRDELCNHTENIGIDTVEN